MKSSNLAECLDQYEAEIESLNLTEAPFTRRLEAGAAAGEEILRKPRRTSRRLGIEIRDQGLRLFRVC